MKISLPQIRPSIAVLLMSLIFPLSVFADVQNSECFDDSVVIEITDPSSEGIGCVFFPNPIASTGNRSLTNMNDADYEALEPAYRWF